MQEQLIPPTQNKPSGGSPSTSVVSPLHNVTATASTGSAVVRFENKNKLRRKRIKRTKRIETNAALRGNIFASTTSKSPYVFFRFPQFPLPLLSLIRKCSTGNLSPPNGSMLPILWMLTSRLYTHNTLLFDFVLALSASPAPRPVSIQPSNVTRRLSGV